MQCNGKVHVWLMAIDVETNGIWLSAYPTKTARDTALADWIRDASGDDPACAAALEALGRGDVESAAREYFNLNEECRDRCQLDDMDVDFTTPER